jgi:uncharacterized protein (TIGR02596 family)
MKSLRLRAFSLVELLVVIAVIGIVATFAVPAVQGMMKGSALSTASSLMVDQMSLARQHSLSKNRVVEVRFYKFADPELPGENVQDPETGHFRALQTFEMAEGGTMVPVGKVVRMPDTIMMNSGDEISNLLGEEPAWLTEPDPRIDPELPRGVKHNYKFVAFKFLPDGTTSLSPTGKKGQPSEGGKWFITVHTEADRVRTNGDSTPPPNFFTWQIDPVSGSSKILRPGL